MWLGLWLTAVLSWGQPINPTVFQTQIRPLLTGIERDFLEILHLFPNYPKSLTQYWQQSIALKQTGQKWLRLAPQSIPLKFFPHLKALEKKVIELEESLKTFNYFKENGSDPEAQKILEEALELLQKLRESITETFNDRESSSLTGEQIYQMLEEVNTFVSVLMEKPIPVKHQASFSKTLRYFYLPVIILVQKEHRREVLEKRLHQFNMAWNEHNQIVEKRTTDLPSTMKQYFSLINQRWNQVMKVVQRL